MFKNWIHAFFNSFSLNLKIKVTSQEVTKDKDPKCVDAVRNGREKFMEKVKENILNDAEKGGRDTTNWSNETTSPTTNSSNESTGATNNSSNETTSVTNTVTTRSNDTYVYGIVMLAVLAIVVCVFFAYNTFQPKNKKTVNE